MCATVKANAVDTDATAALGAAAGIDDGNVRRSTALGVLDR